MNLDKLAGPEMTGRQDNLGNRATATHTGTATAGTTVTGTKPGGPTGYDPG